MGFTQLPEVQARGKQRPVNTGGKLLATRIQRIHTRRFRRRLDNAGVRVRLHQAHQTGQTVARHNGVGVQHHHIAVLVTPATAEVIDVTAFTLHTTAAATVKDLPFALHFCNQFHPRFLLSNADIGVVAIAQNINVEVRRVTGGFHRLPGSAQSGEDAIHVFVTNRHDQRSTVLGIQGFIPHRRVRNAIFVTAYQKLQEAHQRGPETGRDPTEEYGE